MGEYKDGFNKAMESLAAVTADTRKGKSVEPFNKMKFDSKNRVNPKKPIDPSSPS